MIKMTRFRKVVMAVVLFSIIWGSVFVAVQILQGRITATVNVTQWVLVDDKTIATGSGTITETISATQGLPSYSPTIHTLKLAIAADKVLVVKMESTVVDGISVWREYKLVPSIGTTNIDDDDLLLTN